MSQTQAPTLPELMRRDHMAALLSCSLSQVGVMRRRGDLPESFKLGNARYWRRADVLAWLDRCATPAASAATPAASAATSEGGAA